MSLLAAKTGEYNLVSPQSLGKYPKGSTFIYSFHKASGKGKKEKKKRHKKRKAANFANLTDRGQPSHNSVFSVSRKARML